MSIPPTNHRPPTPDTVPMAPASAELADAVRSGVAETVRVTLREIVRHAGIDGVTFVDDATTLPVPDGERPLCTVPVVATIGSPCDRGAHHDGGSRPGAEAGVGTELGGAGCGVGDTVGDGVESTEGSNETLGWLVAPVSDETLLRPWAEWMARWLGLATTVERLRTLAFSDDLTAAGNRRSFDRFLPRAIAQARERQRPLALMVFDIDNFKRYNDEFGHDAGDAVLIETVALLRAVIRRGDRVFRIGGDEFVVVFADPEGQRGDGGGAGHVASVDQVVGRFRQRVGELSLPQLGHTGPGTVTISAGLATYPWDGSDAASLLSHADRLALESKRRGKNIITFGPGTEPMIGPRDEP